MTWILLKNFVRFYIITFTLNLNFALTSQV